MNVMPGQRSSALVIVGIVAISVSRVLAYDNKTTHRFVSQVAVSKSYLQTSQLLRAPLDIDGTTAFPNGAGSKKDVAGLIADGSQFEDAFPKFRNHFFNPLTGLGLGDGVFGKPSPSWALEDDFTYDGLLEGQDYSLRDLHSYLVKALTLESKSARDSYFGRAFRALGHVIHHIEDMAQPQHTRDDAHLPLTEDALYEKFTAERFKTVDEFAATYGAATYPLPAAPSFKTARDFWTAQAGGMADYSNAGFVTTETNFAFNGIGFVQESGYPTPQPALPPIVMTVSQVAQAFPDTPANIITSLNELGGVFYFFSWPVADAFAGQATTNDFTTTFLGVLGGPAPPRQLRPSHSVPYVHIESIQFRSGERQTASPRGCVQRWVHQPRLARHRPYRRNACAAT